MRAGQANTLTNLYGDISGSVYDIPALEASDLTLSWDGKTTVIKKASLQVGIGEINCVVGRSGCGKTTLLHALAGLRRPLSGSVYVSGQDVTGMPGHVAYQLQKDLLLPNLRIIDNVCLPLTISGMSRADAHAKAAPMLERFGLLGVEKKWPSELSGGMRQRAAFLRTYLTGSRVVLLDEPFSALDALTRVDLRAWFCEMVVEVGLAALVVTHDIDEALLIGRHVYVLAGSPAQGITTRISDIVDVPQTNDPLMVDEIRRRVLAALG